NRARILSGLPRRRAVGAFFPASAPARACPEFITKAEREAYLAAVGAAGDAELDAQCRGAWNRIRVVREQDVRDVGPDKSCEATEHGGGFARTGAFALVVDANQIEAPAVPGQFHTSTCMP